MHRILPLSVLLLFTACGTSPERGNIDAGIPGLQFKHTAEEAEQFVRRYESLSVGLVNYFEPARCELISREFSCETLVFRLDGTGDTGALWRAASDRGAELVDEHRWPEARVIAENQHEGHLALVRVESIGIPAGAVGGDLIPVRVTLLGNSRDIRGGYVYPTPLKNRLGKTVAVLQQGILPMAPEKAITDEQRREAALMERRELAGQPVFILRASVRLTAEVGEGELVADRIVIPLMREKPPGSGEYVRTLSADLAPQVVPQIEALMAEEGMPVRALLEGNNLVVVPLGVREYSLRQVFERLQNLRVTIKPVSNVLVIFDEQLVRIAIYGPAQFRHLVRDVTLTVDPFTRGKTGVKPVALRFRLSCRVLERAVPGTSRRYGVATDEDRAAGRKVDGSQGRVRLAWSRWNDSGSIVAEDTEEFPSTDISEVLRFLWTRGMEPPEAMAFVDEARVGSALACELGFNLMKIDVQKMREEMERDQAAATRNN